MAQKVVVYVFMTVCCFFFPKGRIPRTKQYYGAIWVVFYGFSEALSLAQNCINAVLEALKRYLSIVYGCFPWLKDEGKEYRRT